MTVPKASWASTLRLPKSTFPPRAVLVDRQRYLKQCTDDLYVWQSSAPSTSPTFTLHDGPPYANGSLHIGHALNKILKDIACRVQSSLGRKVNYVPGWDCHGLPIEVKALEKQKELGKLSDGGQLGPVAVRNVARELATNTVEEQKAGFREWAIMADWKNAWKTMDKDFELRQLDVFKSMLQKGLIYRKFKPVYWSPSSHTALAEAELEYNANHQSTAAFVVFPFVNYPKQFRSLIGPGEQVNALIWTTTPWTLLANKAIAVHSNLDYVLVRSKAHGVLVIAKPRLDEVGKLCNWETAPENLATFSGSELVGTTYRHPALQPDAASQPIFHADFVSADSGSGLVHVAPGHGMEDYKLCLQKGIEPFAPVDDYGRFTKNAFPHSPEIFAGKEVLGEGNRAVLALFSERGAVVASHKYGHNYPYDWRSKQPVIIRATRQWFADVGEIRGAALRSLEGVKFLPESGKDRLTSFIQNRSEWCISRQRAWGVPIPALYAKDSDEAYLTPESVDHIVKVIRERGIDAWWTDSEFEPEWVPVSLRGSGEFRRGRDTMDVWFDSGTSWTYMGADIHGAPRLADMYIEGTDQHRGWFQSSLLTKIAYDAASTETEPKAPYKTLITHGFTLDQHGKKMSKSLGNVISPDQIMQGTLLPPIKKKKAKFQPSSNELILYDAMGPDALRLWVASSDYTRDVTIGRPVLKAINSSLAKLRVTFKLFTAILDSHDLNRTIDFDVLGTNDQLALLALQRLNVSVQQSYASHEYHRGIIAINQYINVDLSAVYIESIKDRVYADATNSPSRQEAQITVWEIFKSLARMLAPITPLLIEEACDHLPKQLASYHPVKAAWAPKEYISSGVAGVRENKLLESDLTAINALNTSVKSAQELARAEKKMGSSLQSFVTISVDGESSAGPERCLERIIEMNLAALEDMLVVSKLELLRNSKSVPLDSAAWQYSSTCEYQGQKATVTVYEPHDDKCVRCWKYTVPKDTDLEDPICNRCVGVIEGLREHSDVATLLGDRPNLDAAAKACRGLKTVEVVHRHWDHQ